MNEKATWALQVLKSLHNFDLVVIEQLLSHIREHRNILVNYELHAP